MKTGNDLVRPSRRRFTAPQDEASRRRFTAPQDEASRRRFTAPQDDEGYVLQTADSLMLRSGAAASRSISIAAAMLVFTLFPIEALACSCRPGDPEITRQQATVIIEGNVIEVKREGDINGLVTAQISVTKQIKGKTPPAVTVTTRGNSAACGVAFKSGQKGEFLLMREQGRYSTNLCLMMGARQ